ncbi:MAG: hypothetical protein GY861_22015 [bacterium]|nr:hypothetical protein [bacterium]
MTIYVEEWDRYIPLTTYIRQVLEPTSSEKGILERLLSDYVNLQESYARLIDTLADKNVLTLEEIADIVHSNGERYTIEVDNESNE